MNWSPPTVSLVRFISSFCGRLLQQNSVYVPFRPFGISFFLTKWNVSCPLPTLLFLLFFFLAIHFINRPKLLDTEWIHSFCISGSGWFTSSRISIILPIFSLKTAVAKWDSIRTVWSIPVIVGFGFFEFFVMIFLSCWYFFDSIFNDVSEFCKLLMFLFFKILEIFSFVDAVSIFSDTDRLNSGFNVTDNWFI